MRWQRQLVVARIVLAATAGWVSAAAAAEPPVDPYAACRAHLLRAPRDYEAAYCFYRVTFEARRWDEGARVFETLIARAPDNPWLVLAYGHVYRSRAPDRAEALYRRAASAFAAADDVAGEVEARANLASFLRPKARVEEARRELEQVLTLAAGTRDPLVQAQARILQAAHVQETGGDLGVAYRLLKDAQEILPEQPPYLRERALLIALGAAAFRMGRLDEALATYRRLERLALARGEALVLANARYNILNTSESIEAQLPTPGARDRLIAMAEASLETAIAAQNVDVAAKSHRALADLLATDRPARQRALGHARACLALAAQARQPADQAACAWIVASLLASAETGEARAARDAAIAATMRDDNPRTHAYSAGRQMRLRWQTAARPEAVRDALTALATIETLRALQDDGRSSADLFASWTRDYYWLSGRLLEEEGRDVALAFSVTERMRARSLLEGLGRSRQPLVATHPAVVTRRSALERIAEAQRGLLDPQLAGPVREARLRDLERLERLEQEASRQVALAFPGRSAAPAFASLGAVQSALADDQAFLSFQVGLWATYGGEAEGGSWLIAVTRTGRTVHRLPDRVQLSAAVPMFNGLIEGGLPAEAAGATRLYGSLLADALAALPATVTRLVIAPDGPLHHLPFEALRATPHAPPLGARYEIVLAPSATLWLQWRQAQPRSPSGRLLTLADPALAGEAGVAASRNATLLGGLALGRLPHARVESRAIARHVGGGDVLVGAYASEQALKRTRLGSYDVLHFAAHAVADQARPERSAVLLAAGAPTEDGLLQAREIAGLDLGGSIVVLSACQTAAGTVLSGEGVLSLARAFFEGGAHAVIGTRWPLRDADAASLFDTFYRHLALGATLSSALRATREEARAGGRPPSAWAGLVLLGDGDLRPFGGRRVPATHDATRHAPLVAAVMLLVVAGVIVARRASPRA
jgi:hypothetical protein